MDLPRELLILLNKQNFAEKAMVEIFKAWNGSNANLSNVLKWSLHNDPCDNWIGCSCGINYETYEPVPAKDVTSIL